jgi:pilus assembly protein CpaE
MRSLRGLIVCEDPELRTRIQDLLREGGEVEPALVLDRYPGRLETARHLNLCRPDIALLVIDRLPSVLEFLKQLESSTPVIPVIGISRLQDPRALAELMRLGMRDCVAAPLNKIRFDEAIHRIASQFNEVIHRLPVDPLVSFVPSRGGSGTSTLACNISYSMASLPDSHVILVDLDTTSGLSRFVFRLTPAFSFGEQVESGCVLDSQGWSKCVVAADQLDVIHGGRLNPRQTFTANQMTQFLASVSGRYSAICADLTGGMETYSLELLRRSRLILLVSTTDAPSIQMAREKLAFLATLDLLPRIRILLTLNPKAVAPNVSQMQATLGIPVQAVFDFGEERVRRCLQEPSLIPRKTLLGRQISQFSQELKTRLADVSNQGLN